MSMTTVTKLVDRDGVPEVVYPLVGKAQVRMPYAPDNKLYLHWLLPVKAKWDPASKVWEVPRRYVYDLIDGLGLDYPAGVRLRWEMRAGFDKCDTRCRSAQRLECACACGGAHHGADYWGGEWELVGSTTLIRHGETFWLTRVVTAANALETA